MLNLLTMPDSRRDWLCLVLLLAVLSLYACTAHRPRDLRPYRPANYRSQTTAEFNSAQQAQRRATSPSQKQ